MACWEENFGVKGKAPLGRPRRRWGIKSKWMFSRMGECVPDWDKAVVKSVINFWIL